MAKYVVFFTYTSDSWERLIKNPVPGRPGVHAAPTFELADSFASGGSDERSGA